MNPEKRETWSAVFTIESWSARDAFPAMAEPRVEVKKNTARLSLDKLDVNYYNTSEGLQQTFLVRERPGDALAVTLRVEANGLALEADPTGEFAILVEPITGAEVLRYAGLRAFDAQGRSLPQRWPSLTARA